MINKIKDKIVDLIKKIKDRFTTPKKWKLLIYFEYQHVKTIRVLESDAPLKKVYVCDIWFRKHLFKTNHARVVLLPIKVLFNDNDKRMTHVEAVLYEGVDGE